ncbi:MAG: DUF2235 domain-containing protein [Candidatus Hydrogenedentota bacterium]
MPKNIVVFSDGTGQEGGTGNNTNVYKLFNMLEDRSARQVTFYDRGLGTGFRKITGNAGGMGISTNIRECYEFIFEHYEAGDKIYLFGFSRGATTIRSLASFIRLFRILPKSRPELIKEAYSIYRKKKDRRKRAEAFVERHHSMWVDIEFIGVWDTVSALCFPHKVKGIPTKWIDSWVNRIPFFRHKYHELTLKSNVKTVRHALAIDDVRELFHPTFYYPLAKADLDPDSELELDMKQVWFAGMHSDVGGGYEEQELSDNALEWMVHEATTAGLLTYSNHKVILKPDPDGTMHDSRNTDAKKSLFAELQRTWPNDKLGDPVVHESVTQRKKNGDNGDDPAYEPWIMKGNYTVES